MSIIYEDDTRTLTLEGDILTASLKASRKRGITCSLSAAKIGSPHPKLREDLRKRGGKWFQVYRVGSSGKTFPEMCLPESARAAVEGAIKGVAREAQERKRVAENTCNRPENVAQAKIDALLAKADCIENSTSEDNVMVPAQLRAEASKLHADWVKKYPKAAQAERRAKRLGQADHLEHLAKGALLYDADGWLDEKARQARHDKLMAEATALREA